MPGALSVGGGWEGGDGTCTSFGAGEVAAREDAVVGRFPVCGALGRAVEELLMLSAGCYIAKLKRAADISVGHEDERVFGMGGGDEEYAHGCLRDNVGTCGGRGLNMYYSGRVLACQLMTAAAAQAWPSAWKPYAVAEVESSGGSKCLLGRGCASIAESQQLTVEDGESKRSTEFLKNHFN